jgi:TonB family protein
MSSAAARRFVFVAVAAAALAGCTAAPPPTPLDLVPKVTSRVFPAYPEAAKRTGVEGKVTVWMYVNEDGSVTRIETRSSPNELLTGAAVDALRRWRFEVPVEDGRRIPFMVEYSVEFSLTGTPYVATHSRNLRPVSWHLDECIKGPADNFRLKPRMELV